VDYVPLPGTVTIPAGAASVTIPVTPIDDVFAEPTESVTLTLNLSPGYVAGSPSQAAISIVSDDLPPDLIVAVLTTPALAVPGAAMTIGDTTKNQGGAAPASLTGFYLSPNVLLDAQDVFLGTRSIPSLAAGAVSSGSVNVTVPANTVTGTYYVLARADNANTIAESQELNNVKFSTAIRVGPDLVVSSFTPPAAAGAGATISLGDTTKNDGSVSSEPSRTAFYLSANALLDAGDTLLGSRVVPILPAGATNAASTPVQIPAGTATGTYFLFAKADLNSEVTESSETNNASFAVAIRVGPDLTVSAITVSPTSVSAGATITVNETTKNTGGGAAAASTTRYYLSTNFAFDSGDVLIGSRPVPALAAGASSAGSTVLTVPAGTAAGNYYLISVADGTGVVVETSEVNNTLFGILRVVGGFRP
jgi:subtilase family serine protease